MATSKKKSGAGADLQAFLASQAQDARDLEELIENQRKASKEKERAFFATRKEKRTAGNLTSGHLVAQLPIMCSLPADLQALLEESSLNAKVQRNTAQIADLTAANKVLGIKMAESRGTTLAARMDTDPSTIPLATRNRFAELLGLDLAEAEADADSTETEADTEHPDHDAAADEAESTPSSLENPANPEGLAEAV